MSPREIVPADLLEKMTVAASLGNTKASLGVALTPYQSKFFDKLEVQVRELQEAGMVVEIAREIPELATTIHMVPQRE